MEAANKNKPLKTAAYIYRPPPFEDNLDEVQLIIALYYRQLSANIQMKTYKIKTR